MNDEHRKDRKHVLPSQPCPKCGGWVDTKELVANNGVCLRCYPALAALEDTFGAWKESEAKSHG